MAILSFTLSEEGVAVLHDALACLVKFSDDVCLEGSKDQLTLTALNLSKSAYVRITLSASRFFSQYSFDGSGQFREKFFCQLYIRVCSVKLLSYYIDLLTHRTVTTFHLPDPGCKRGPDKGQGQGDYY
jgi:hypothetical protein